MRPTSGRGHVSIVFFFVASPTSAIYTLSLHDALPIFADNAVADVGRGVAGAEVEHIEGPAAVAHHRVVDRKSTRLMSSHVPPTDALCHLRKTVTDGVSGNCVVQAGGEHHLLQRRAACH